MPRPKDVRIHLSIGIVLLAILCAIPFAAAQVSHGAAAAQSPPSIRVWELAKAGGFMMIILLLMSIGGLALIIYNVQTLQIDNLAPGIFSERLIELLEKSDERGVRQLCSKNHNIFSRIVIAGLSKKRRGPAFVREAMENSARQEIGAMWHQISFLADLGSIGPLLGLLGTVLGMIQAFSSIAFQAASVKPVLLVGGVSKAMVCTAGGLVVAIPALLAYSFFKARVIHISRVVETHTAEMIKIIEDRHENFLGDTYVQI